MNKADLKPFDQVLVRNDEQETWRIELYQTYKATFVYPYTCMNGSYKYCIPYKGNEACLDKCVAPITSYIPQKGDFVVSGWNIDGIECQWIAIVSWVSNSVEDFYHSHFSMFTKKAFPDDPDYSFGNRCGCVAGGYTRPATEEERQLLLSKLCEIGKDWDAERKKIVTYRLKSN